MTKSKSVVVARLFYALPMPLPPTHTNYYHVCRRKLWLFANGIQRDYTSELVAEGKQIGKIVLGMGSQNKCNITN